MNNDYYYKDITLLQTHMYIFYYNKIDYTNINNVTYLYQRSLCIVILSLVFLSSNF